MNKKAYRNKRLERLNVEFNLNLPRQASGEDGLSGDMPRGGIGRGYSSLLLNETQTVQNEREEGEEFGKRLPKKDDFNHSKMTDLLLLLSDEMDKEAKYAYSDFSDFLIRKIAQQNIIDYQLLLKEMVMKINNSDIINKYDFIISLIREYNALLKDFLNDTNPDLAHKEAYQMVATMAANYV